MAIDGASSRWYGLAVALLVGGAAVSALPTSPVAPGLARQATGSPAPSPEVPAPCAAPDGRRVAVASAEELASALEEARPGDAIILADGVYPGRFVIAASGTPEAPITLCGSRRAVLAGGSTDRGYGVHLRADHWRLVGFTVTDSQKGIVADGANHNVLRGLAVYNVGQEGIHFRAFSSYNLLEDSEVHNVGVREGHNGEGVYVGSAHSNWCEYTDCQPDRSDFNEIRNNTIGPNTTAESVDIKEGTTGGVVAENTFSGAGMSDADSWVDVKGNGYRIAANVGLRAPTDGFQTHVESNGWGRDNVFRGNVADVHGDGYGVRIDGGEADPRGNAVGCDNRVDNAAEGLANVECTP